MERKGPVFEKIRSVENVYNMRLTALLRELVRDGGFRGAAQTLHLDQRTVARAYRARRTVTPGPQCIGARTSGG